MAQASRSKRLYASTYAVDTGIGGLTEARYNT